MSRILQRLSFCLILLGLNILNAKTVPHICHAFLKMHTLVDMQEMSDSKGDAIRSLEAFVKREEDTETDFLKDADIYLSGVATISSSDEHPMDIATAKARVRQLLLDDTQLGDDLSQVGGMAIAQISGVDNIEIALKLLRSSLEEFRSENAIHDNHRRRTSYVNQLWGLSFFSLIGGAGAFFAKLSHWQSELTGFGALLAAYMLYSASRVRDLDPTLLSVEANSVLMDFLSQVEKLQASKTEDWQSFHGDLKISRKFLRVIAKQSGVSRDVFNEELWRQSSRAHAESAQLESSYNEFDEVTLKVDFIYTSPSGEDLKPKLILVLRTEDIWENTRGSGGRRERSSNPDGLGAIPEGAFSY